ncbi:hypothetical protein BH23GEM9_BH23GEM9_24740 [soil metagenome]
MWHRSALLTRWATVTALAILMGPACSRRAPLPDLAGSLVEVIVEAVHEAGVSSPLLLDSTSFTRVGVVAASAPFTETELRAQFAHPFQLVDAANVLECPEGRPCRVRGNATYVEIWEAETDAGALQLVVSRVFNVEGLYTLTRSSTYRLTIAAATGGWRLTARERLPE